MLSETGKTLPNGRSVHGYRTGYATALATALRDELGGTHQAIKTIMRWTGVSERTARNWLSGITGPSGEHLISLAKHSDLVFEVLLALAERDRILVTSRLVEARDTLYQIVEMVDSMLEEEHSGSS